jgi:ZIP family zinc transporter
VEGFTSLSLVVQAFIAGTGTYLLTVLGTLPVLFFRTTPRRTMAALFGFAAGVMVAASCWSLLQPAMERGGVMPAAVGLLVGGLAMLGLDRFITSLRERSLANRQNPWLLMTAMTIHNVPEGLAVGVAFGAGEPGAAIALAIGIGLQNIPEGLAVALPLRAQGMGRGKALMIGQFSAIVEPPAAALGAALVMASQSILPYGMAFAAGAMLYVVAKELIPEPARRGHVTTAAMSFLIGFVVMMVLDNTLG